MKQERTVLLYNGKVTDRDMPLQNGQQCFDDVTKKTLTHYDGKLYDANGTIILDLTKGNGNA
jgi:hypothetical protein